jgi:hypothetical protein
MSGLCRICPALGPDMSRQHGSHAAEKKIGSQDDESRSR